ncbi:thioredoxin [Teladorsagia circumcincta]|uniref:protein disulfide-isomerase n=1 Tax=Teladorsagia circumcincta TaxID=45464 RepID=A0A2G9UUX6_TELCI|nr:thioredoxin [Teladorsagia circumcincta]
MSKDTGARTAQGISSTVLDEVKKAVSARLGGKSGGGSKESGGGGGGSGSDDVIELTDSNFEKLGALDATVHTVMASKFGVRGFPTIKYFAPGSSESDAVDYDGGRTTSDIVSWATSKAMENLPPPEVVQATSPEIVEEQCQGKQLCIFAFLPHILDCQAKCREKYLSLLRDLGDYFKKNGWGWIWVEGGSQSELEEALSVGGFGYPAMVALNYRKMKFSMLKGSFDKDGIREFLRDLSYGKGQTAPIKGATFPKVIKIEPWDGKDGVPPKEEEIDLSDVDLDHTEL